MPNVDVYLGGAKAISQAITRLSRDWPAIDQILFSDVQRIAVVGNGATLGGSRLGDYIDSHDVVVRINDFISIAHVDDVGKKVDIVIVSPYTRSSPDLVRASMDASVPILVYNPLSLSSTEIYARMSRDDGCGLPLSRITILPPEFTLFSLQTVGGRIDTWPSTGVAAVLFAARQFKRGAEIATFGLGWQGVSDKAGIPHLSGHRTRLDGSHDLVAEQSLLTMLARLGHIHAF